MKNNACLLCGSPKLSLVLDLGCTPLANELPASPSEKVETFPLRLVQCGTCQHLQIDELVDEKRLYGNYCYVSDTGQSNRDYFKSYAESLMRDYPRARNILDIGSNDGLFLSYFHQAGCITTGIDPAENIVKKANQAGIATIRGFFNEPMAQLIFRGYGGFDMITCNNCFAHNADLHTIVDGVKLLLERDGTFVFEATYAPAMLKAGTFDLIYHEHIHHWTVTAADRFFGQHDMKIVDVKMVKTHGGSVRMFVQHQTSPCQPALSVSQALRRESGLAGLVAGFAKRVERTKRQLRKRLKGTVSILGYPAKASTLLYYFDINDRIDNVYDDNPLKIGRYTHAGKPIRSTDSLPAGQPFLVLSWNYADQLIARHGGHGRTFIVPLPTVRTL